MACRLLAGIRHKRRSAARQGTPPARHITLYKELAWMTVKVMTKVVSQTAMGITHRARW